MKRFLVTFVLLALLTSCTPSTPLQEQIKLIVVGTLAAIPTSSPYPTYTSQPSFTPQPTYTFAPTYTFVPTYTPIVIIVTATGSPTTLYTPTITETPTKTVKPTNTYSPLQSNKGPGIYLVGEDIAPGVWRSLGTGSNCYWEIDTRTGDIISNYLDVAGGTMYIAPSAFQVLMHPECGDWKYLGPP
jgi:hypothetical protein